MIVTGGFGGGAISTFGWGGSGTGYIPETDIPVYIPEIVDASTFELLLQTTRPRLGLTADDIKPALVVGTDIAEVETAPIRPDAETATNGHQIETVTNEPRMSATVSKPSVTAEEVKPEAETDASKPETDTDTDKPEW
jgi:hypothetical protein